ncbi:MAG: DUF1385 domain-containing protein [Chloroflexi bacterium]|nr:DUF1385 domain-containing protein [Chloroflexota bacterium]MCY3938223.1 DUF1385 domain-containing protein [Chloroflexota bacterium]
MTTSNTGARDSAQPESSSTEERIRYGGQAVLDGVMMRSRKCVATAVRHPAGHVVVKAEPIEPGRLARAFRRVPVIRGAAAMWDILVLGMKSLAFSAEVSVEPEEKPTNGAEPDGDDTEAGGFIWVSLGLGLVLGIALFFVVPLFLVRTLDAGIESDFVSNLVEGVIRLAILLAYLSVIGLLPDIRRTFEYHGAEHKTVNALEAGDELTVARVMRHSAAHPRCGTNFLLVVVLLSILVFALLGRPDLPIRVGSRILLVPVIAGLAFELIRFLAAHRGNPLVTLLLAPGLWLQAITTRTPTPDQVEVAIIAMGQVLRSEGLATAPAHADLGLEIRA